MPPVINGDEPFFSNDVIPKLLIDYQTDPNFYVTNAMSEIKRVSDALDPANIKVVVNSLGYGGRSRVNSTAIRIFAHNISKVCCLGRLAMKP